VTALNTQHYRVMAFLKYGALVPHRDGWRFGTTTVGDNIVKQLIVAGKAVRICRGEPGDCVVRRSAA
jgi:hypothetical protein